MSPATPGRVRIEQVRGTGVRVWHELEVDDAGRVECPLCRRWLPVAIVVAHLQPAPSGAVLPMDDDERSAASEPWESSW